jgi:ATP-binding cassette subfamily B protein
MASRTKGRLVLANLWQAAWRARDPTLAAHVLLVAAKLAAVGVPLLLKAIVDRLGAPAAAAALPVALLVAYALLRFASTLFTELRDLVFAKVTLRTVALFAERTFAHLMSLSPRFHVQRNTGSLIRDIERGTTGIGFLLGAGLFTVLPTLVEFGAVLAVMASGYSLAFTGVILATFVVYAAYTTALTQRRSLQQRRVNEVDSTAVGTTVNTPAPSR